MNKDQGYGFIIFIVSIIIAIVYLVAFFAPCIGLPAYLHDWAVGIPVLLFMLLVLLISGWIGWTMLTTPPPLPLEAETQAVTPQPRTRTRSRPKRSRPARKKR
jgi:protein-S-isoprenylcysteine O-methyltransferase Ste14